MLDNITDYGKKLQSVEMWLYRRMYEYYGQITYEMRSTGQSKNKEEKCWKNQEEAIAFLGHVLRKEELEDVTVT